jgi:UDP-glucose 4-epimerase
VVFGDGEQTRDFTYIANVVQANLLAATAPQAVGCAINIACGEQISLNTVLRVAGELLRVNPDTEYNEPRPGDIRDSLADISLARNLLAYQPKVGFREGLLHTIDALRKDFPEWQ